QVNPACEIRVLEDDPDRLKTFDRRLHGGRLPVLAADSTHARDARHPAQWSSHADGWAVRSYWAGWVRWDHPDRAGWSGASDRIRTCDLRLRRPTLYPLSYRRGQRSYLLKGIDLRLLVRRTTRRL